MKVRTVAVALAVICCSCEREDPYESTNPEYGLDLSHEMIVLGEKLENPYTTENIRRAYGNLYQTKSRAEINTTNLYVRFLPEDDADFEALEDAGIVFLDHPLDYRIVREGDYYHDPAIPEEGITWQYAVVPKDFSMKGVNYEVIDECCLWENSPVLRSGDGVDWEAVEREAYRITGNESMLPLTRGGGDTFKPKGRITIVDPACNGGKPFGVAGVRVMCNSFVKFSYAYTDRDGYYELPKEFSSDVRYRLMFRNSRGFSIGLNKLLVPASVSTLGKASPEGVSMTLNEESEARMFARCVVNNAAYEYVTRCGGNDLDLPVPQQDIRLWLMGPLDASSAIMAHHGTVVGEEQIAALLGVYAPIVTLFMPDITIGIKDKQSYKSIYDAAIHEMAHTSHFKQVGAKYWDKYIYYIIESFITSEGMIYGSGEGNYAGICEVGEMWAYYMQNKLHQDRYGGNYPSFGCSRWFYPQIFRTLDERGMRPSELLQAMTEDVTSRDLLKDRLKSLYPARQELIEQVFERYK